MSEKERESSPPIIDEGADPRILSLEREVRELKAALNGAFETIDAPSPRQSDPDKRKSYFELDGKAFVMRPIFDDEFRYFVDRPALVWP